MCKEWLVAPGRYSSIPCGCSTYEGFLSASVYNMNYASSLFEVIESPKHLRWILSWGLWARHGSWPQNGWEWSIIYMRTSTSFNCLMVTEMCNVLWAWSRNRGQEVHICWLLADEMHHSIKKYVSVQSDWIYRCFGRVDGTLLFIYY